jgi:stress-induced morphogen
MPNAPRYVTRLTRALRDDLDKVGIRASVSRERVGGGTSLYRIWVVAPQFRRLRNSERQNLVWRTAEEVLSDEELRRISMILTLAPDELGAEDR